ncbi:MAG: CHAT domain-containing protein [Alphaproteobacteria bacterium]|nr:CHAT domain-containing protein [Alphaproteobacteria bacterium]
MLHVPKPPSGPRVNAQELIDRLSRLPWSAQDRLAARAGLAGALPEGATSRLARAQALVAPFRSDLQPLIALIRELWPTLAEGLDAVRSPWWDVRLRPGPRWARLAFLHFDRGADRHPHQAQLHPRPNQATPQVFTAPGPNDALLAFMARLPHLSADLRPAQSRLEMGRRMGGGVDPVLRGRMAEAQVDTLLIRSHPNADAVQELPWELTVLPPEPGVHTRPWRLTPQGAVLREVAEAVHRPPAQGPAPCVLLAWAEPRGDVDAQLHERAIRAALPDGAVELLPDATPERLTHKLTALHQAGRPARVLHLVAHGCQVERGLGGVLLGAAGREQATHADALGAALADAPAPALVSLFACQSPHRDDGAFGPLTATLARRAGVPVIGSQMLIRRTAAVAATKALYGRLFEDGGLVEGLRDAARAAEAASVGGADGAALVGVLVG